MLDTQCDVNAIFIYNSHAAAAAAAAAGGAATGAPGAPAALPPAALLRTCSGVAASTDTMKS